MKEFKIDLIGAPKKMINKKAEIGVLVCFFIVLFLIAWMFIAGMKSAIIHYNEYQNSTEHKQDIRDSFLAFNQAELKFCKSVGMDLNDTYSINGNEIVECINETDLKTYQFSRTSSGNEGFGAGILVGALVFRK
jgi:hypothetical protein